MTWSTNQSSERDDPGRLLDPVEQVGVVHVPRGEVCERPTTRVFELDQPRTARPGWNGLMIAAERLQLGLLIGADDVLVRP
jgi:hypothetical protein